MSQPDRPTDDEAEAEPGPLDSFESILGEDPNFGSFVLTVGIVTCVFIAAFQFTLPSPVSHLLTAGVLLVTVLTAIIASALETLGYFDPDRGTATTQTAEQTDTRPAKPWVVGNRQAAPLPPLLNFDAELRGFAELYDGDLPEQFDSFIEDYRRLKISRKNRTTIASDLRADLNPISVLFEDGSEGDELYQQISDKLFRYIKSDTLDSVSVRSVTFYDTDDTEATVSDLQGQVSRAEFVVENEGEETSVEVAVEFYDGTGTRIGSQTCPVGTIKPAAVREVSADVLVPADATRATTSLKLTGPA
ncbi:FxLYD domain-containing protein [Salinirubrum litoreum]|uniref:FxLYD domain-containing protein n=1 Tax=Salinirubrum litoreum TaxID=1126234 RepID=A0ABD5RAR3_9EURY|nr:FxLYD domain-containing protein [Salinirubrum litoreum]